MKLLYVILIVAVNANTEDEKSQKYIDLLPEEEKDEFLNKVARRIMEEVKSYDVPEKSSVEVSDDELNAHSAYVRQVLKEETKKFKEEKEERKKDDGSISDGSVKIKDSEESKENDHLDLTRSRSGDKIFTSGENLTKTDDGNTAATESTVHDSATTVDEGLHALNATEFKDVPTEVAVSEISTDSNEPNIVLDVSKSLRKSGQPHPDLFGVEDNGNDDVTNGDANNRYTGESTTTDIPVTETETTVEPSSSLSNSTAYEETTATTENGEVTTETDTTTADNTETDLPTTTETVTTIKTTAKKMKLLRIDHNETRLDKKTKATKTGAKSTTTTLVVELNMRANENITTKADEPIEAIDFGLKEGFVNIDDIQLPKSITNGKDEVENKAVTSRIVQERANDKTKKPPRSKINNKFDKDVLRSNKIKTIFDFIKIEKDREGKIKEYEVIEIEPGKSPFIELNKKSAHRPRRSKYRKSLRKFHVKPELIISDVDRVSVDQNEPNYVPIYDYSAKNAYYDPTNKLDATNNRNLRNDAEQPAYAVEYNYLPENAYYNPKNRKGPNYNDKIDFVHTSELDGQGDASGNEGDSIQDIARTFHLIGYISSPRNKRIKYNKPTTEIAKIPVLFPKVLHQNLPLSKMYSEDLYSYRTKGDLRENPLDTIGNEKKDLYNATEIDNFKAILDGLMRLKNPRPMIERRNGVDIEHYLDVLTNLIDNDDASLQQFDWLTTTVDFRAAIVKINDLIEKLQDGDDIVAPDAEIIRYLVYLSGINRQMYAQDRDDSVLDNDGSDYGYKMYLLDSIKTFYEQLSNVLYDFHESIKGIASVTKYNKQNWYRNIKDLYLIKASRKDMLRVLAHLFSTRVLDSIENACKSGLEDGFDDYAKSNVKELENTKEDVVLLKKIILEVNK